MLKYLTIGFIIAAICAILTLEASNSLFFALVAYSGAGSLTVLIFSLVDYCFSRLRGKKRVHGH